MFVFEKSGSCFSDRNTNFIFVFNLDNTSVECEFLKENIIELLVEHGVTVLSSTEAIREGEMVTIGEGEIVKLRRIGVGGGEEERKNSRYFLPRSPSQFLHFFLSPAVPFILFFFPPNLPPQ